MDKHRHVETASGHSATEEDDMNVRENRELALKILTGNYCEWPGISDASDFIAYTESQGVLILLENHSAFIRENWPEEIAKAVVIAAAAGKRMLQHRADITTRMLDLCHANRLEALLFKGAANAFLLYENPHQRQHADIDLLVREDDTGRIAELLAQMNFSIDPFKTSEFGPYQTTATRYSEKHPVVMVDLHWRINNRLLLADALIFDELWQRSQVIDQYGESARGFGYQDALLAVCIHDAGALPAERNRLIALHDAHLLMKKLGHQEIHELLQTAADKGIGRICLDYLTRATDSFNSGEQRQWLDQLAPGLDTIHRESSAKLLNARSSWMRDHWLDFEAVNGAGAKSRYLKDKLLGRLKSD